MHTIAHAKMHQQEQLKPLVGDLEVSDFTRSNVEIKAFGSVNRQWFLAYIGSQLC